MALGIKTLVTSDVERQRIPVILVAIKPVKLHSARLELKMGGLRKARVVRKYLNRQHKQPLTTA